MKQFKMNAAMAGLALGAGFLIGAGAPDVAQARGAGKAKSQHVTITVSGSGYAPSTVSVKDGQPVRLTFHSKGDSCANTVSIPALKKTLSLKPGQKKDVVFTPKKGQTIAFACSMKMFKGKVVAR